MMNPMNVEECRRGAADDGLAWEETPIGRVLRSGFIALFSKKDVGLIRQDEQFHSSALAAHVACRTIMERFQAEVDDRRRGEEAGSRFFTDSQLERKFEDVFSLYVFFIAPGVTTEVSIETALECCMKRSLALPWGFVYRGEVEKPPVLSREATGLCRSA